MQSQIIVDRFLRSSFSIGLNVYEKMLLVILASYAGLKSECFPSQSTLAINCSISKDSIKRYTKSLERKGLIKIIRELGENNRYQLSIPSANSTQCFQQLAITDHSTTCHESLLLSADSTANNINNNINKYTSENSVTNPSFDKKNLATCPHEKIISLYHEILSDHPKVRSWTPKRKRALQNLWQDNPKHQTLDFWKWFFEFIKESQWLTGQNQKGWKASLAWIVEMDNFTNIIEEFYK